jgi:RNA polymerase sigma-70 factor (ECF subfamily)
MVSSLTESSVSIHRIALRAAEETAMVYPEVHGGLCSSSTDDSRRELGVKEERDEVLVRRVAESGDERAFSELYDRYVGLVYGAGIRYLRERTHAEDLVQEVFLSVWRGAASFDVSKAGFATWIYRITRNRATDHVRRRRSRVRTVGSEFPLEPEEVDPAGDLSRSFDIVAALSRLTPVHREVLTLAYMEGLTQREISRRTDMPLGTVKSRTTAALLALRENVSITDRQTEDE